jgi:hypothetical protein
LLPPRQAGTGQEPAQLIIKNKRFDAGKPEQEMIFNGMSWIIMQFIISKVCPAKN